MAVQYGVTDEKDLGLQSSMPKEYTPEMTQKFYESMARPIQQGTDINVGKARSEALARGMEGDPFESLGVASARARGTEQLGDLWANISMQGAGLARQERMAGEQRAWQSDEAEKARQFEGTEATHRFDLADKMADKDYDLWRDKEALANRRGYQTAIWNKAAQQGDDIAGFFKNMGSGYMGGVGGK